VDQEAAYLSPAEVRRVLDRLSRADIVRLSLLARNWLQGLPSRSPDDLVNEAMERILSGRRPWPYDLDWGAFFNGVMRSIADQWRKEDRRMPLAEDVGAEFDGPAPEQDLEVADMIGRMRHALIEDPPAREMFEHMLVDRDRDDIKSTMGMDETAFDTVRRRLFRHLRLAFVSGWKV